MGTRALRSRINLSKKCIRRRSLYAKKSFFRLIGGPVQAAWLSTPGTLVFRLGEWRGMYNADNEWVPM